MTKADILLQVKKAEEDAKSIIIEGKQAKEKKIVEAKSRGRELIETAKKSAIENAEHKIAQAKDRIQSEKEIIIQEGLAEAESIKTKANKNLAKSTEFLLEQFEMTIYA